MTASRFDMRALTAWLLLLCIVPALQAQVVDEASFRGTLLLGSKRMPYALQVLYRPDAWRGSADYDRSVEKIRLDINGRKITFSPTALAGLYNMTEPSAIYTSAGNPSHGLFTIKDGHGEKLFEVTFEFNAEHLVSRTLRYTRRAAENLPTEIIRFGRTGR